MFELPKIIFDFIVWLWGLDVKFWHRLEGGGGYYVMVKIRCGMWLVQLLTYLCLFPEKQL